MLKGHWTEEERDRYIELLQERGVGVKSYTSNLDGTYTFNVIQQYPGQAEEIMLEYKNGKV